MIDHISNPIYNLQLLQDSHNGWKSKIYVKENGIWRNTGSVRSLKTVRSNRGGGGGGGGGGGR